MGCVDSDSCKIVQANITDAHFIHYKPNWVVSHECKDGKCVMFDKVYQKYQDQLKFNVFAVFRKIFN